MESTSAGSAGISIPSAASAQASSGRFMLTLCALASPVAMRPPQAPQLKSFTFFTSRVRQSDGSERLYAHMGFFETFADADRWAESVRHLYPRAFATLAPLALMRTAGAEPAQPGFAPSPDKSSGAQLSDTQVLEILEARRAVSAATDTGEGDGVALLRPEDTGIRKALKEAVAQGAPVSFAVQLQWSERPIELALVQRLDVFRGHTLYATENHRRSRSRYFLRLGFFSDPASATRVAVRARSAFPSAAVIPVIEPEITRSREAASNRSGIPSLAAPRVEEEIDFDSADTRALTKHGQVEEKRPFSDPDDEREMFIEPDPLSQSGVRHLKVEVQEQLSGRWRVVKLREAAESLRVD